MRRFDSANAGHTPVGRESELDQSGTLIQVPSDGFSREPGVLHDLAVVQQTGGSFGADAGDVVGSAGSAEVPDTAGTSNPATTSARSEST